MLRVCLIVSGSRELDPSVQNVLDNFWKLRAGFRMLRVCLIVSGSRELDPSVQNVLDNF